MLDTGKKTYKNSQTTGNSKTIWIILPILLLFVSITSFLAGTHIGRATDHRLGQMLDTIVLSPENEAVNPNRIDFSGQIFYTDGSPCANRVIELHSDPRRTTTDSEGVFHFKDVETGTHNLALLDDSGRQESQVEIHIDRESGIQTGKVTGNAEAYQLAVSENVIAVHIRLQLDENDGITVAPDVYTRDAGADHYKDTTGKTADPVAAQPAANDQSNIPESGEGLIDQENTTDPAAQAAGQAQSQPLTPSAQDQSNSAAAESVPIAGQESTAESLEQPSQSPAETSAAAGNQTQPNHSDSDSDSSHDHSSRPPTPSTDPTEPTEPSNPTDPTDPTDPTEPTDPPDPTDPTEPDQPADVQVQEKNGPVWQQNTEISLFADRTGAGEDRKLMPGSKGSYEFLVSNRNSYEIRYQMKISAPEGQLLLPLRYRLKSDGQYLCGDQDTWLTAEQLSAESVNLDPGEEKEYLLEWQWLFAGGNDILDTKIGSAADLEYRVIVMIHAEQTTS